MIRTIQRNILRNKFGSNKAMSNYWKYHFKAKQPPARRKENKSRVRRILAKISRLFNRRA